LGDNAKVYVALALCAVAIVLIAVAGVSYDRYQDARVELACIEATGTYKDGGCLLNEKR